MYLTTVLFAAPLLRLHAPPDASILTLTAGILLIYLELNRPGGVIPGACGLLLVLLSAASLLKATVEPFPALLAFGSFAVFGVSLRRSVHLLVLLGSTVCLIVAFAHLTRAPFPHRTTAISCGLLIGGVTSILTSIARRARLNKRLD